MTAWTVACQALVYGNFQGRILVWVAIPFSKGSSQPNDHIFFLEKEKAFLEKGKTSVFKNRKSLQLMLDNFMLTERGRKMAIFFFSGFVHNCALKKILIFEMLVIIKCNVRKKS